MVFFLGHWNLSIERLVNYHSHYHVSLLNSPIMICSDFDNDAHHFQENGVYFTLHPDAS